MASAYDTIFVSDDINKAPNAITMGSSKVRQYSPWIDERLKGIPEEIVKIVKKERTFMKTSSESIAKFFTNDRRQPFFFNLGCNCCFRPEVHQFLYWCTNGRLQRMDEVPERFQQLLAFSSTYFVEKCEDCKECEVHENCQNSQMSNLDKYEKEEISQQNYALHAVSMLYVLKAFNTFQECRIGKDAVEKRRTCLENFEYLLNLHKPKA